MHHQHQQNLNLLRAQWLHVRKRRLEDMKSRIRLDSIGFDWETCSILNAELNAVIHKYHAHLIDQIKQLSSNVEDWHEEILNALDDDDLLYILDHRLESKYFCRKQL